MPDYTSLFVYRYLKTIVKHMVTIKADSVIRRTHSEAFHIQLFFSTEISLYSLHDYKVHGY